MSDPAKEKAAPRSRKARLAASNQNVADPSSLSKALVLSENPTPVVPVSLAGREIIEKEARELFDNFRAAEAKLQTYINGFPDGNRERYMLMQRYRGQLKRWLASWKRNESKSPSHPAWREIPRKSND